MNLAELFAGTQQAVSGAQAGQPDLGEILQRLMNQQAFAQQSPQPMDLNDPRMDQLRAIDGSYRQDSGEVDSFGVPLLIRRSTQGDRSYHNFPNNGTGYRTGGGY